MNKEELREFIIRVMDSEDNNRMNIEIDHSMKLSEKILHEYKPLYEAVTKNLEAIQRQLNAQSEGLQNVYNKFSKLTDTIDSLCSIRDANLEMIEKISKIISIIKECDE